MPLNSSNGTAQAIRNISTLLFYAGTLLRKAGILFKCHGCECSSRMAPTVGVCLKLAQCPQVLPSRANMLLLCHPTTRCYHHYLC